MPPLKDVISPTGHHRIRSDAGGVTPEQARSDLISGAHAELERCQQLRAEAQATPLSAEWDEMDMATYLRHLDETEAGLRARL